MTRDALLGSGSRLAEWEPKALSRTTAAAAVVVTADCLKRIFSHLPRADCARAALVCRAWSTPALEHVWASFKFVRERDFERVFATITRRGAARPYGLFVRSLELVHADRDFVLSPNVLLLVTTACPNLESIAITFNNTRPVAPPIIMQNRPVLPPIKRPGDVHPPHHPIHSPQHLPPRPNTSTNHASQPPQQQPPPRQHNHSLPLAHLAHNCRALRSIRLTSYSPKTDDSVYEMAKYMKSGALRSIVFTGCSTLQGSTLCKLALTNPQLRHIEIMGNTPVSDSSLATLAEHCAHNLESLSIGNAHHLTDVSVRHVAKRCRNLKQLILFNNCDGNKLHEDTISDLIRNCPHLRVLSLSNARILTQPFFELVVSRVERELRAIEQKRSQTAGLQRLCLGGVRRDVVQSSAIARLIQLSANSANSGSEDEDDAHSDDDISTPGNTLSHFIGSAAHMPKTTVIRGSSIWWQRRRPAFDPHTS